MLHQIVEINKEHKFINLYRGFIQISSKEDVPTRQQVPIDDIESLVLTAHSTTVTKQLLVALAEKGTCTVLCDNTYNPIAMVMPPAGVGHAAAVAKHQAKASEPLNKRLWKEIIKAKIANQADILTKTTNNKQVINKLKLYAKDVQSDDKTNREGVAARLYWQSLFDKNFRRDRDQDGINAYLNYGYAILRATIARAVCAVGLLPVLGLHHKNESNQMALVDDLMEPYRPLIDLAVWRLHQQKTLADLNPEDKQVLAKMLYYPINTERGRALLVNAVYSYTTSLALAYRQKSSSRFFIPSLADENKSIEEEGW